MHLFGLIKFNIAVTISGNIWVRCLAFSYEGAGYQTTMFSIIRPPLYLLSHSHHDNKTFIGVFTDVNEVHQDI